MNYKKEIGKHYLTALGGAERRLERSTFTQNYYMGYDDTSLAYKIFNPLELANYVDGTEAIEGYFNWSYLDNNKLAHLEDRFVYFYANASYTYDMKYNFKGSIRMDQSNLFGTDPKYQYRPLWSLGASWELGNESFIKDNYADINRLTLTATYGIGDNVPKEAGF